MRVSLLAPDLAMSHLHSSRVKYEDMEFGRSLGEGAYSLVYQVPNLFDLFWVFGFCWGLWSDGGVARAGYAQGRLGGGDQEA